jgi:hypothetical protein
MSVGSTAFGSPQRYYSCATAPDLAQFVEGRGAADSQIARLLENYDPELESRVLRSFRQWNNVVRDQLRNEMGLRLSIGDEAQAIPVRVAPGIPGPLRDVIEAIPISLWRFLLELPTLEATVNGLDSLINIYSSVGPDSFPREIPEFMPPAIIEAKNFCDFLFDVLQRIEIRKRLGSIREDILGSYFFRVPEVRLYWMVIGLVAGILGVTVESLTVVVATHELAHAYSHLGRDIDGTRWDTENFARADLNIVEGIAQFYTGVVSRKLENRNPSALIAYQKLVEIQQGPYRVHEEWVKRKSGDTTTAMSQAGEVVRSALVQCRSCGIIDYGAMKQVIERSAEQLGV